jgi:hypothetical protein
MWKVNLDLGSSKHMPANTRNTRTLDHRADFLSRKVLQECFGSVARRIAPVS